MIWHEANYDGLVQLRYSFRLYPTSGQCIALAKAFGCARVVFNDALAARQAAYVAGLPYVTDAALSARLTATKATPERAWLSEVSAVVLQQAQADLNAAYRNFFAFSRVSGRGRRSAAPVPVPQGPSADDPVHPQCQVHGSAGREAAPAEDRGRTGARGPGPCRLSRPA